MYIAALILITETGEEGNIDLAHMAVLTLLEEIEIDLVQIESRKIHWYGWTCNCNFNSMDSL